jgi:hypothetical protein
VNYRGKVYPDREVGRSEIANLHIWCQKGKYSFNPSSLYIGRSTSVDISVCGWVPYIKLHMLHIQPQCNISVGVLTTGSVCWVTQEDKIYTCVE